MQYTQYDIILYIKLAIKTLLLAVAIFSLSGCKEKPLISLFPLDNYDQQLSNWVKPDQANYQQPLLSDAEHQKRLAAFYKHYIGEKSPWHAVYVTKTLVQVAPDDLLSFEKSTLAHFDNKGKKKRIGYGENFRAYDKSWLDKIANKMNISQFKTLTYRPANRAIAIDNLHARALPTDDVYFYNHQFAGEGYPFDNLQVSALWVGTPVYILGETKDRLWMLVLTADYVAWVKTKGIARVDARFINTWTAQAKKHLAAIIKHDTSLLDKKHSVLAHASIGAFFPAKNATANNLTLFVPTMNSKQEASIQEVSVTTKEAALMPLKTTPKHFAMLMNAMLGRPYGWGNMYFYHDCSSELKSIFMPFGIWLPRHSSEQLNAGKIVDKTAASKEERLTYLMTHGKPFFTIVYVGSHVFLYIGNFPSDTQTISEIAMTYQNIWGFSPASRDRRAVIGKSVLLPLLLKYPEDTSLVSLVEKPYFKITFLDQAPDKTL